jgi:subtilisin family serine protease
MERTPGSLSLGASVDGGTGDEPTHRFFLNPEVDRANAVQNLPEQATDASAETDYLAISTALLSDRKCSDQWGLARIEAPGAWDSVTSTREVVIALVDAGLSSSHPDLAGQLWVNPGEVPGNGLDDDNNGHVDDVHGWNMIDDNADLSDNTGHGTTMAGIIAAAKNGEGRAGVCSACRLMIVKVTRPDGLAYYSDIIEGVTYAAENGADVINISLRGREDSATMAAVVAATSQVAVIVSGTGNDGGNAPVYPAAYGGVLAVAGTDMDDRKTNVSNYGTWVDVSAPGKEIGTISDSGACQSTSGTSVAAAFVSGLAGLLQSQHPDWPPEVVRAQIIRTANDIDAQNPGYEGQLGSGRINACRAATTPAQLPRTPQDNSRRGRPRGRQDPVSIATWR